MTGILNLGTTSHQSRAKYDGEIVYAHAVLGLMFLDLVEVEGDGSEGGVVGIGEGVYYGVERVAAKGFVFVFWKLIRFPLYMHV